MNWFVSRGSMAIQWIALLAALVLNPAALIAQDETAEQTKISYQTPLVHYGDVNLSIGYFFQYSRGNLSDLNRVPPEQRKEFIDSVIRDVIFDHLMVEQAKQGGYFEEKEFKVHNWNMMSDLLSRFYTYHQFNKNFEAAEEEINELYEQKKESFFLPPQFSFRHIFFRTIDMPEDKQALAKENALKAQALIKAGSDFAEVARLYSDSPQKDGVIGPKNTRDYVKEGERPINPVIEDALMELEVGQVSDIIQTRYGYEILKLESFLDQRYQPLSQVRNMLIGEIREKKFNQWKRDLVESHWQNAVSKYRIDVLNKENPEPDEVIAVVHGHDIDHYIYNYIKGRDAMRKSDESDEDYRKRHDEYFRYTILYRFIAAELAKDLGYENIPALQLMANTYRNSQLAQVWKQRMLDKYIEENPVTEEEKKQYYEANEMRFRDTPKARISEMTFYIPEHDENVMYEIYKAQKQAEDKANRALERLKTGEDFAAVAKEMSESERAAKGGVVGIVSQNDKEPLPSNVIYQAVRLPEGNFSDKPIKTDEAFYIVRNDENLERQVLPFSNPEIQDRVERGLVNERKSEYLQSLKREWVKDDEIEILDERVYTLNPATDIQWPTLNPPGEE